MESDRKFTSQRIKVRQELICSHNEKISQAGKSAESFVQSTGSISVFSSMCDVITGWPPTSKRGHNNSWPQICMQNLPEEVSLALS